MNQSTNRNLFTKKNKKQISNEIKSLQHGLGETLSRAETLISGNIIFQNDWDMERSNIPVPFDFQNFNWNYTPSKDLEWSYMLHRVGYLQDLVVAFIITDDIKYIDFLQKFLKEYFKHNYYNESNKAFSWRTIDVGIRLINLLRLHEILTKIELNLHIDFSVLNEYFDYLVKNIDKSRSQSNWAIIESTAIIMFEIYNKTFSFNSEIFNYFMNALRLQILSDGLQWEQSFTYHHEVLIRILQVIQAMKTNDLQVPETLLSYAVNMSYASLNLMRTDYKQSNFGDSDIEDLHALLLSSEKILEQDFTPYKYNSHIFDYLLTFDVGSSKGSAIWKDKHLFKEAGIALLRNYSLNDTLLFSNGPLGGGHGHDDYVHFEYLVSNEAFLIDSGRYTYFDENGSRLKFKTPMAHNTVTIDHKSYNKHINSWESEKVFNPMNDRVFLGNKINLLEGGHFGYSEGKPVYINRKIVYNNSRFMLIFDQVKSEEKVSLNVNFTLNSKKYIQKESEIIYFLNDETMIIKSLDNLTPSIIEVEVSPQYNLSYQTDRVIYQKEIDNGFLSTLVASKVQANIYKKAVKSPRGINYASNVVECFVFDKNDVECHILIQHEEPSDSRTAYCIDKFMFYGRLIYFEVRDGKIIYEEKIR